MTHIEYLLLKASIYWSAGSRLPLDLFAEMMSIGIDVGAAEEKFNQEEQD